MDDTGDEMFTGGCQCGAVRYAVELATKPVVYACHCRECQRQSASGFGLSAPVPGEALTVTGEISVYERATDSGSRTHCYFCPVCGTRLYHRSERSPELATLKAGTLDNAADLRPVAHLWTSRKHGWLWLNESAELFATQPDDIKAWRSRLMEPLIKQRH